MKLKCALLLAAIAIIEFAPFLAIADQIVPGACRPLYNNGWPYFGDNEKVEYSSGFAAWHFNLRANHPERDYWTEEIFLHRPDCTDTILNAPGVKIENFRPGLLLWSIRFSSATHYDFWDDEQDIKINCQNCSGDLPVGNYTTVSLSGFNCYGNAWE